MAKTLSKYRKTINELEAVASKFWPSELSELEAKLSIIPLLVSTQDIFIAVIGTGAKTLNGLFSIVEQSELPANLFLKHLSILADYGGEMLQRVSREFGNLFPDGQLNFIWGGKPQQYAFLSLPKRKLNSKALRIDGKEILKGISQDFLQQPV